MLTDILETLYLMERRYIEMQLFPSGNLMLGTDLDEEMA
jgi:hypothetical protein